MKGLKEYNFWFLVGSQHLYGHAALDEVNQNANIITEKLNQSENIRYPIICKQVLTNTNDIKEVMLQANMDPNCAGVIVWMHTFSPGKKWIPGLSLLQKPLLHLHTQFHREIPWEHIDMDYMNLHQSAHGDREFGYAAAILNISRKVIVGYWNDMRIHQQINIWMNIAIAYLESKNLRIARFGDNMRNVADTEGDKVQAQRVFGWSVDTYGIGDLVEKIHRVEDDRVQQLLKEYKHLYNINTLNSNSYWSAVESQARIELGIRDFLEEGKYDAFTTTFEDLHGMKQLPGLAVQRLMADGYGFGAEGDWKTAALLRLLKMISNNQNTTFMEFYTYHLESGNELVLGSHMLEVCPTISASKPSIQVHPLGIGGKEDPARLVFDGKAGEGILASLVEIHGNYIMLINEIETIAPLHDTPKLPVSKVIWKPLPSFAEAAEAWIYAGGSHHTVLSLSVTKDDLFELASMMNIECFVIDENLNMQEWRQRMNSIYRA
jgi:L-arabinose isomerase